MRRGHGHHEKLGEPRTGQIDPDTELGRRRRDGTDGLRHHGRYNKPRFANMMAAKWFNFVGADLFRADADTAAPWRACDIPDQPRRKSRLADRCACFAGLDRTGHQSKRPVHLACNRNCTPRRVIRGQCSDKFGDLQSRIEKFRRRERRIQFYRSPSPVRYHDLFKSRSGFDATNGPNFADLMDTKSRSISVIPDLPPKGASRLRILESFEVDGAFAG